MHTHARAVCIHMQGMRRYSFSNLQTSSISAHFPSTCCLALATGSTRRPACFLIGKGSGVCLCDSISYSPFSCQTPGPRSWEQKKKKKTHTQDFAPAFYSNINFSSLQEQLIFPVEDDREKPLSFGLPPERRAGAVGEQRPAGLPPPPLSQDESISEQNSHKT